MDFKLDILNKMDTELELYDEESQESYTLKLSPTDAIKAQNDMVFATALLNYARQNKNKNETVHVEMDTAASLCLSTNDTNVQTPPQTDLDEELEGNFRWPHEAVILLLEEYRQREQDMHSGRISHKKAWDQIAQAMNSKGYIVTSRQCTTRVNTMKRTYKAVRGHNRKSGNNKRPWKYFELMESLLSEKPYIMPLSTISSTGVKTFNSRRASTSSMSSNSDIYGDETSDQNISVSHKSECRKRKANDDIKTILQSQAKENKLAEENKQKRHEERMEVKKLIANKLIAQLDKILEKL